MTRSADATRVDEPGTHRVAWQGWELTVPEAWNPVRIEGDDATGSLLLSDLTSPRLALRWRLPVGRQFDPETWARKALVEEVGQLAADEAVPVEGQFTGWTVGRLYTEPAPPGRDVFVGQSAASGRLLQVVYHATRRDRQLRDRLLPTLSESSPDGVRRWAVFELSCETPPGWRLQSQRLHAGDLRLVFARRGGLLVVRQVAVAELALKRLSLDRWLGTQQYESRRHYRPTGQPQPTTLRLRDGREIAGLARTMSRRRRWWFQRWRPRQLVTLALHDPRRDRLLIGEGNDESVVREALRSVGWASTA